MKGGSTGNKWSKAGRGCVGQAHAGIRMQSGHQRRCLRFPRPVDACRHALLTCSSACRTPAPPAQCPSSCGSAAAWHPRPASPRRGESRPPPNCYLLQRLCRPAPAAAAGEGEHAGGCQPMVAACCWQKRRFQRGGEQLAPCSAPATALALLLLCPPLPSPGLLCRCPCLM